MRKTGSQFSVNGLTKADHHVFVGVNASNRPLFISTFNDTIQSKLLTVASSLDVSLQSVPSTLSIPGGNCKLKSDENRSGTNKKFVSTTTVVGHYTICSPDSKLIHNKSVIKLSTYD